MTLQQRLPENLMPKARVCKHCGRPLFVENVDEDVFRCKCSEGIFSVQEDSVLVDVVAS
jgi:hypothetical protein